MVHEVRYAGELAIMITVVLSDINISSMLCGCVTSCLMWIGGIMVDVHGKKYRL